MLFHEKTHYYIKMPCKITKITAMSPPDSMLTWHNCNKKAHGMPQSMRCVQRVRKRNKRTGSRCTGDPEIQK